MVANEALLSMWVQYHFPPASESPLLPCSEFFEFSYILVGRTARSLAYASIKWYEGYELIPGHLPELRFNSQSYIKYLLWKYQFFSTFIDL